MKAISQGRRRQSGSSMIEVLVTLAILMLGLLGLVGLMLQSQRSQQESYQRVQAVVMIDDMVNRINANRGVVQCYAFTTAANGTPFLGNGYSAIPGCTSGTAGQQARAIQDMREWNNLLLGTTEAVAPNVNVGGMIGARGCVELVSAGVYRISVVWQGNSETFPPAAEVACATGLFGTEPQRRAVSVNLSIS